MVLVMADVAFATAGQGATVADPRRAGVAGQLVQGLVLAGGLQLGTLLGEFGDRLLAFLVAWVF